MKSRLLPPPIADDREENQGAPSPSFDRRMTDRVAVEVETPAVEPTLAPAQVVEPAASVTRPAPQVSARPNGRFIVVGILLACLLTVSYCVWSTFLRDAAFGVVTGKVTAISTPWAGTLTAVYIRAGDTVRQDEVLAVVDDPELQATMDRLSDDLRGAQAELDSQAAKLALAARERSNHADEIRADYYDLRGKLLAEQSRYEELSSKLERRRALAKRQAVSGEEIESLRFVKQGLAAKIENLQLALTALEPRLNSLPADDHDAAQLKPWLAQIENFQAEIRRLRDKQRRGTIRAPLNGIVVDVPSHVGERATPEQPLLELLPDGSLELVLYVQQEDADAYQIGQSVEVVVEPVDERITCRITRVGQRFERPQSHVAGRYRPAEKLLPVYLSPSAELPIGTTLRLGSMIRLPAKLFGTSP